MRRILLCAALAALASVTATPAAHARSRAIVEVKRGNPVRAALLNALRPLIAKDLQQPVKLVVKELRVQGGWAWAVVDPRTPAGREINFWKTRYKPNLDAGAFDGSTCYALLRREKGGWRVKAFSIGATDVAWDTWPEEFGAPRELLFDEFGATR